jgi:hypothetical protein
VSLHMEVYRQSRPVIPTSLLWGSSWTSFSDGLTASVNSQVPSYRFERVGKDGADGRLDGLYSSLNVMPHGKACQELRTTFGQSHRI